MDAELRAVAHHVARSPEDAALRARYAGLLVRATSTRACAAALADLVAWDAADALLQDATLARVAEALPAVEWVGAETFACGGQAHRVGVFAHRATGVVLHLLPGGRYERGTADPRRELAYWVEALPEAAREEYPVLDAAALRRWLEDEVPAHPARVRPLLLARAAVTEAEWARGPEVRRWWRPEAPPPPDAPHLDTEPTAFDDWVAGAGLRLPTEAEWEWACRAGTTTRFFWGDAPDPSRHHGRGEHGRPGLAAHANAFGLRDPVGSQYELCADLTDGGPQYRPAEVQRALAGYARRRGHRTPTGDGAGRRLRGGTTDRAPSFEARVARRISCTSGALFPIGCRPALDVPPPLAEPPGAAEAGDDAAGPADGDARRLAGLTVRLVGGDIAFRPVQAIVCAANDELVMGGGVAGALRAAGGPALEREATQHAPAALGAVVRTGAGELLADHVYHAVVLRHDHRASTSPETVRVAVREVLALAAEDRVETLAVPLLGAGAGGLGVTRALGALLDALEEHAPRPGRAALRTVEVVVLDPGELEEARAALRAHRDRAQRDADEARAAQAYLEELERRRDAP